jgi:hypothetical protein
MGVPLAFEQSAPSVDHTMIRITHMQLLSRVQNGKCMVNVRCIYIYLSVVPTHLASQLFYLLRQLLAVLSVLPLCRLLALDNLHCPDPE